MNRWYTIRVVAVGAAAWAFALAAALFHGRHAYVIIAANVATTASVWVIARMSVDRIKGHIINYTSPDVRKFSH